jgi:5-methylcytosine-specific restriction protein A
MCNERPFVPPLKIGEVVSNSNLMGIFQCANSGGMRYSKTTNTLLLISWIEGKDKSQVSVNPYYDYVTEKLIYYTGMGLKGDQCLYAPQNCRLRDSNKDENKNLGLYFFIASYIFPGGNYKYLGKVKLIGTPRQAIQPDSNGVNRKVWMFPLKFALEGEELQKLNGELSLLKNVFPPFAAQRIPDFCD